MYRAKNDTENLGWGERMYPTMRMSQPGGVELELERRSHRFLDPSHQSVYEPWQGKPAEL